MAKRITARPSAPTASTGNAQDAADRLENTLAQLRSLLWLCHGEEIDWTHGPAAQHLENLLWLAADLARKADELFQQSEAERRSSNASERQGPSGS